MSIKKASSLLYDTDFAELRGLGLPDGNSLFTFFGSKYMYFVGKNFFLAINRSRKLNALLLICLKIGQAG